MEDRQQRPPPQPPSLSPSFVMPKETFQVFKKGAAARARRWMQPLLHRRRHRSLGWSKWLHAPYTVANSTNRGTAGWNPMSKKASDGTFWGVRRVLLHQILEECALAPDQSWPPVPAFERTNLPTNRRAAAPKRSWPREFDDGHACRSGTNCRPDSEIVKRRGSKDPTPPGYATSCRRTTSAGRSM